MHLNLLSSCTNQLAWLRTVVGLVGMELASITAAHMAFWIGAWNNADNTTVFWLLLNSTCKTARLSLFPAPGPFPLLLRGKMEEVAIRLKGGDSWESWLQLVKGLFPTMLASCSATKTRAEEKRAVFWGGCWSATGHQSDCRRIWVIAFAWFIPGPSFFHLINGIYLDPPVLWLSFFLFSPAAHLGQQLCGCLAAGPGEPTTVQEVCDHNITFWFLCSDEILHHH